MENVLSNVVKQINGAMFAVGNDETIKRLENDIEQKQNELRRMMTDLYAIKNGANVFLTEGMLESLMRLFPYLHLRAGGQEAQFLLQVTNGAPVRFHFGVGDPDPVYYITAPVYRFQLDIIRSGNFSIRNVSIIDSNRYNGSVLFKERQDVSYSGWGHPHISRHEQSYSERRGPEPFETICYGNNRFSTFMRWNEPETLTPTNLILTVRGFALWSQMANTTDMYGTRILPEVYLKEDIIADMPVDDLFAMAQEWRDSLDSDPTAQLAGLCTGDETPMSRELQCYGGKVLPSMSFGFCYALWLHKHLNEITTNRYVSNEAFTGAIKEDLALLYRDLNETHEESVTYINGPENAFFLNDMYKLYFEAPRRLKEFLEERGSTSPLLKQIK